MIKIGIDPDVDKSGVCLMEDGNIELQNLSFFDLFDFLKSHKKNNVHVVVEAGWLNKSNWHKKIGASAALNSKIGSHVGANHEVGKKIVEMAKYLGLEHSLVRPTRRKLKKEAFASITGIKYRTNQEQRDACMLVFGM